MTELSEYNQRFFHFKSKQKCNEFVINNNIQIMHYCCHGVGFSIRSDEQTLNNIEAIIHNVNNKYIIKKTTDDNCCVCLEKSESLTICGHVLCNECHTSMKTNICPYCRTQLDKI